MGRLQSGEDVSSTDGGSPERALRVVPDPVQGAASCSPPIPCCGHEQASTVRPGASQQQGPQLPSNATACRGGNDGSVPGGRPGFVLLLLGLR